MQFHLDRAIPIPLAEQIRGQITYAISSELLTAGQALPSVRELSASLGVAPATVARVYRELARQSLVFSKPGAGTFVADIARLDGSVALQASQSTLQQLAEGYVGQAVVLGMPPKKLMRQEIPAPPGLRSFRPFRSAAVLSGFLVVYQFWKPSENQGPSRWLRNLVARVLLTRVPGLPSQAFQVVSILRP